MKKYNNVLDSYTICLILNSIGNSILKPYFWVNHRKYTVLLFQISFQQQLIQRFNKSSEAKVATRNNAVLPDQISKYSWKLFWNVHKKFTYRKLKIGSRRKPSEYVGNCRNVRKFPNKYEETFEKGISFCIFKFILTIFNNGQVNQIENWSRICFCIGSKMVL